LFSYVKYLILGKILKKEFYLKKNKFIKKVR